MKPFGTLALSMLVSASPSSAYPQNLVLKTVSQTGYTVKYNPNASGNPGICADAIKALEKLDPSVKFTGLETWATTARIMSMLDDGSIDIFFGLARNAEREAKYLFPTPPLYTSVQYLFVKSNDTVKIGSFDDVKKLGAEGVVLVIAGSTQEEYLKSIGGLMIDGGTADTLKNLQKLASDRGRFYYGSDINTFEIINGDPELKGKIKALPIKFQPAEIYGAFSKKADPKVVSRVQANIKRLAASGELDRIYKKYVE